MIHIILHHTGLELCKSKKIVNHPSVLNDAKKRNKSPEKLLLDLSTHYPAIEDLKGHGRPDIAHICLLEFYYSVRILKQYFLADKIKFTVHTINDEIFEISEDWRVPASFIRFRGLMEKLLDEKEIRVNKNFELKLRSETLSEYLKNLQSHKIYNLTEKGPFNSKFIPSVYNEIRSEKNIILLIGGYQKGNFDTSFENVEDVSILQQNLTSVKVLNLIFNFVIGRVTEIYN